MKKTKIVYHFDALCGWCYGFTAVMDSIHSKYKDLIEFEVVSGGLFLGERVGSINDVAPYIKSGAYLQVEQRTKVKFGEAFIQGALNDNSVHMDSSFPAIALCIVKEKYSDKAMEYASTLLKAFYTDGVSSDDIELYGKYAQKIGMDIPDFDSLLRDSHYVKLAREDFAYNASQKIGGFPALRLITEEGISRLSTGYTDFETLDGKLRAQIEILKN